MKNKYVLYLFLILTTHTAQGSEENAVTYKQWKKEIPVAIDLQDKSTIEKSFEISKKKSYDMMQKPEFKSLLSEINSNEFQIKQAAYRNQIEGILSGETKTIKERSDEQYSQGRVIVFISETIPLTTLRNISRDLEKIGGVMYMRGMIGGMNKVLPTALFSSNVLKIDPSCTHNCRHRATQIMIDPILFRKYGIKRVPAVTIQKGFNILDYCHSNIDVKTNPIVTYGDASLKYHLERYQEMSNDKIKHLIKKI